MRGTPLTIPMTLRLSMVSDARTAGASLDEGKVRTRPPTSVRPIVAVVVDVEGVV